MYYKFLLTETGDNKREAAKLAKVNYSTFTSQLNKMKLQKGAKRKN